MKKIMEVGQKMDKKALGIFGLFILLTVTFIQARPTVPTTNSPIQYNAIVCKKLLSPSGELIQDLGCDKNVITNDGLDHIKYLLGQGVSSGAVDYIALGNGTAPTQSSTDLNSEITNCGLSRAQGTFVNNGVGNWSIFKTFTSTCNNVPVNTTALFNATTGGIIFAGDNFTTVNMQNGYQLQIYWTIWTQEG